MQYNINPTVLLSLLPLLTALTTAFPVESAEITRRDDVSSWDTPYSKGESDADGHGYSSWNAGPGCTGSYCSGSTSWKRDDVSSWDTPYSKGESDADGHGSESWNAGPDCTGPYCSGSTSWKRDEVSSWDTPYSKGETDADGHGYSSWNAGPDCTGSYCSGTSSWKRDNDATEDVKREAAEWDTPYSKGESDADGHGYSSWNAGPGCTGSYCSGSTSWKREAGTIDDVKREAAEWNTPYSHGESDADGHGYSDWSSPYGSGSSSWKA